MEFLDKDIIILKMYTSSRRERTKSQKNKGDLTVEKSQVALKFLGNDQ